MSAQSSLSSPGDTGIIDWINDYGWYVLYAVLGLMCLSVIGYRMSLGSKQRAETDYLLAEKEFQTFQQKGNQEAFSAFSSFVNQYPDLHAKYDGLAAQALLNRGQVKEAEAFADLALLRTTDDQLPFYTDYAVISLMISKGDFHEALDKTQRLKQEMLKNLELTEVHKEGRKFGDILFAFNLLREALLLGQVGDFVKERETWSTFKQYAGLEQGQKHAISPFAFQQLLRQFESGKESLVTFIQQRENILTSKS